jgi:chromosome segregation ATPase
LRAAVAKNRKRRLETKLSAQTQSYAELRERFDDLLLHKVQFARKEDAARGHLLMATRRVERLQEELARLRLVCASPDPERRPESAETSAPAP